MKRLIWIEAVLLLLASTSQAQEYRPEDFLPLVVGNSWTYMHGYVDMDYLHPVPGYQWPDERPPQWVLDQGGGGEVTITITHTEQIDGHTYYVFSGMPYEWPPAPYFFLAGKKVRFAEDGRLMERWQDTEEICLFDFGEVETYAVPGSKGLYLGVETYAISEREGDTGVGKRLTHFEVLPDRIQFLFGGHEPSRESRDAEFLQFYGLKSINITYRPHIRDLDYPTFLNVVDPLYAILDGERIDVGDAVNAPTFVLPRSWGGVKRMWPAILQRGDR